MWSLEMKKKKQREQAREKFAHVHAREGASHKGRKIMQKSTNPKTFHSQTHVLRLEQSAAILQLQLQGFLGLQL